MRTARRHDTPLTRFLRAYFSSRIAAAATALLLLLMLLLAFLLSPSRSHRAS